MSKKKAAIPNAWDDDDWEVAADVCIQLSEQRPHITILIQLQKLATELPPEEPQVKLSRAERKAKHDEANKQIWEAA
jgi:hypothetical protein